MWFQQVGVTCHTMRAGIALLPEKFPSSVVSLLGGWKDRVYAHKPLTLEHLQINILATISQKMVLNYNTLHKLSSRAFELSSFSHMPRL